jgi:hypothetical protein
LVEAGKIISAGKANMSISPEKIGVFGEIVS